MTSNGHYSHVSGSGPGAITPDGCAVELYSLLPAGETPGLIHEAIPAGASVLDLGAGVGRIADPLVGLGHAVVAVDESPQMLEHVRDAETVCSRIEELRLEQGFDVVLLASHLVNVPDDSARASLLATCAFHLRPGGVVLVERFTRAWVDELAGGTNDSLGLRSELKVLERPHPGFVTAAVEYQAGGRRWTQTFTTRGLDDDELSEQLAVVGLQLDRVLTADATWVSAVSA